MFVTSSNHLGFNIYIQVHIYAIIHMSFHFNIYDYIRIYICIYMMTNMIYVNIHLKWCNHPISSSQFPSFTLDSPAKAPWGAQANLSPWTTLEVNPSIFPKSLPLCSMYGIFTSIWLKFIVICIGKYSIHGAYGIGNGKLKTHLNPLKSASSPQP